MSEKITEKLSLERKIGQLFFIGLPGAELDAAAQSLLDEIAPGGVCLFSRNIRQASQTRKLLADISDNLPVAPILSIDQEGGLVDRLRRVITPMPSAENISRYGNLDDVKKLAGVTAEILRILGFNMNFAPVVDVVDETRAKFSNGLQTRMFFEESAYPDYAAAYLKELQDGGCLGSIKHFPGLGASENDSHDSLPIVNLSEDEFYDSEIPVYGKLIETADVEMVMVGHVAYPNVRLQETDSNGKLLPTSLSANFINRLLRQQLNFKKLVISDDLEMGAILKNYGVGEACKMGLKAGLDMLLICAEADSIREGYRAVLEAAVSGEIPEARIDESLERIFAFKALLQEPLAYDEARLSELSGEIAALNTKLDYRYGG